MQDRDIYQDIIGELFTRGLMAYLDHHQIGKRIDEAITQAVDLAIPRKVRMVLTPVEAAKVLGVSRNTFDDMVKHDEVPHYRKGSKVFVPIPALQIYLQCPDWFERHGIDRSAMQRLAEFQQAG